MTHYQLVSSNKKRSFLVMLGFIIFIVLTTYIMAQGFNFNLSIVGMAFIFSGISSFFGYFFSDKIILTISRAKKASREEYFNYYTVTENLTLAANIPMPDLYVIEDTAMNAFATGRNPEHAVICATTGLLQRLNRTEIESVVAHEISHIKNYDILLMSIVTVLVGSISLIADWMLRSHRFTNNRKRNANNGNIQALLIVVGMILALLSPLIAQLMKLALSRRREFLADASGVALTKNPRGLQSALIKISKDNEPLEAANKATAHLYISDPLKNLHGAIGAFANLFRTHPPVEKRIQALSTL